MASEGFSGHCLCGQVRYAVDKAPAWVGHCHCASCRRQVASAVATFIGCEKNHFALTGGELSTYASSPGVRRSFCGRCGTPVAYETDNLPGEIHILLGTADDPAAFTPGVQVFCSERLPWLKLDADGPAFDGLPGN